MEEITIAEYCKYFLLFSVRACYLIDKLLQSVFLLKNIKCKIMTREKKEIRGAGYFNDDGIHMFRMRQGDTGRKTVDWRMG